MGTEHGSPPADPHAGLIADMVHAALTTRGDAPVQTRRAALDLAASIGGRGDPPSDAWMPEGIRPLVEKIARHAYKVIDGDVHQLLDAGYSEDAVFELIVGTAIGAGIGRLERGLAALSEGAQEGAWDA